MKKCTRCNKRKKLHSFYKRKSRPSGYNSECKVCSDARHEKWKQEHPGHLQRMHKIKNTEYKKTCVEKYGIDSGCVCCGIKELSFLSMDHIKDDGFKNRDKHGLGKHLYRMLVREGFPPGFQTLCFNCQWGKRLNGGFCPHHPEIDLRKH